MLACKAVLAYGATNSIERSSELRSEILWRIAGAALAAKQSVGLIHVINFFEAFRQPKPEDRAKVTARRADANSIKAAEMERMD